ncbi:MAG: DeoR/GlpR family DNA-binding transcription regulator [Dysgonomonas sp.]|nr:DeoR/GlpR family DNA-binding transcription regulator [Dysgonomonas sp.]
MNKKERIISPELREEIILKHLKDFDNISTEEIAKKVNASEITIRRDLLKLEEKGLLVRTRRGAIKNGTTDNLFAYDDKINQNREAKEYICRIASGFIQPGDIIFIDCGSTVSLLTYYIKRVESLTVITNSLPIASELINFSNIKLILIGGEIDNKRKAIYGYSAINNISQYHANKAFIGADGISLLQGITSYNERSASVTLKMAENSDEVFLLCDSSKIEKNSFVRFAPLSVVDYVITDDGIDHMLIPKYYDECNVNLLCEERNLEIKTNKNEKRTNEPVT